MECSERKLAASCRYYNVPSRRRNGHDASRVARESVTGALPSRVCFVRRATRDSRRQLLTLEGVFRVRVTCSVDDDTRASSWSNMQMRLHVSSRTPLLQCGWRDERAHQFLQKRCSKTIVSPRAPRIAEGVSKFFEPSRSRTSSALRNETTRRNCRLPGTAEQLVERDHQIANSSAKLVTFSNFEIS